MIAWAVFGAVVAALFATDLLTAKALSFRGALFRTVIYVAVAIGFGAYVWAIRGPDDGLKFFTGYTLEASLSLDNVFVMSLIFGALAIPEAQRHRVLLIGILTALVLRGVFIGAGAALVGHFDWLLWVCGGFLLWTGVKVLFSSDEAEVDLESNRALKLLRRFVPISPTLDGGRFFSRGAATPLLVALVLVEIADLIFAADSVPATLAVTTDPFLVYTSNIFAILGLRSLYVVLERLVSAFEYVGKAVAFVLMFIGAKVILAHPPNVVEIPNDLSLLVVLLFLGCGVGFSLYMRGRNVSA
jgi:tellurite resistance protein TerC